MIFWWCYRILFCPFIRIVFLVSSHLGRLFLHIILEFTFDLTSFKLFFFPFYGCDFNIYSLLKPNLDTGAF